ncbi:MAG: hypothetical protein CSA45_05335 [Gammaproteobacteria bacterium]|nr:MAG: hypothetical protein CSA45_05335 [Gammaproteobacteria bacterium]
MRTATRWSQFVYLLTGQLTKRDSLRDIVENMDAQSHRLYHLGSKRLPRLPLLRLSSRVTVDLLVPMMRAISLFEIDVFKRTDIWYRCSCVRCL